MIEREMGTRMDMKTMKMIITRITEQAILMVWASKEAKTMPTEVGGATIRI